MTPLSVLVFGFLLGMKHATEADHLAAVATLATRSRSLSQAMAHGTAWGIGHTVTLVIFGGLLLVLGATLPHRTAEGLELAVGGMLILLGSDALRRLWRGRIHFHVHTHEGGVRHVHAHGHANEHAPHALSAHAHRHARLPTVELRSQPLWRAVVVGVMHGLAGTASLVVLSIDTTASPQAALLYVLLFGAGSLAGIALLSVAIAVPLRLSAVHIGRAHTAVSTLVGAGTVMLGVVIVYDIGFDRGLLA